MKKITELKEKYPKIIKCGLECGDGWYCILDLLCFHLQWDIDKNGYPQIEATQIKEKFGTLRFYYETTTLGSDTEERDRQTGVQEGMISFVEALSVCVCEDCGTNQGVFQTKGGWIRTTCQFCEDKRGK